MHSRRRLKTVVFDEFPVPDAAENESIARVVALRGSNVCDIEHADGSQTLAQIPTRFRKTVWIKRGNYVIVREPEMRQHVKVRAMVEHILFNPQVKYLKREGLWPAAFVDDDGAVLANDTAFNRSNANSVGDGNDSDDRLDGSAAATTSDSGAAVGESDEGSDGSGSGSSDADDQVDFRSSKPNREGGESLPAAAAASADTDGADSGPGGGVVFAEFDDLLSDNPNRRKNNWDDSDSVSSDDSDD